MDANADLLRKYHEAKAAGRRHEAQLYRTKLGIAAGDLMGGPFASEPPLVLAQRRVVVAAAPPVAFLASFNAVGGDCVFALKQGINRIGWDKIFGDHERPSALRSGVIEGRQWLVIERPGPFMMGPQAAPNPAPAEPVQMLVADDRSTNQSLLLPRDLARLEGTVDPRFDTAPFYYGKMREAPPAGVIALDWEGMVVEPLHEGDVLATCYAALVFGVL